MIGQSLQQLLARHGVAFLAEALGRLEDQPASSLQDSALLADIASAGWQAAPLQMRLAGTDSLGWPGLIPAVSGALFGTIGGRLTLRRDWEKVFGNWLRGEPITPPPVLAEAFAIPGGGDAASESADSDVQAIGIDLGTTYSVVAHIDSQGRPTSIPNVNGEILTPSVVLFDADGPLVGKQAVQAASLNPELVAECVKRDMGAKHFRKPIGGEYLPPEVISSLILKSLKADAERKLGPIEYAVVTVPAYFDEPRRRATMDAGRLAGLKVLDILNEPTAAAVAYGYQQGLLDRQAQVTGTQPIRVLVYDLGGGTFDVTIVELSTGKFGALATDGDVQLGGKDWDEKLVELAAHKFQVQCGSDPRLDPASLQDLWQAAEAAKRTLSELNKAALILNYRGKRLKAEVTRAEFEAATEALLSRTRTTTEIVVLQAGLAWSDIDNVLLVGGSTRMPMVQRMLTELSGRAPDRRVAVDEAVAHGAALVAGLLAQRQGLTLGQAEFAITNVNSHSLGVAGVEPGSGRQVNAVLIRKNSPLPKRATRRFKTARVNQPNIRICVLEGESEHPEACTQVGVCLIRDLPPNLPAGWPVEVQFEYTDNGRLQVSGKLIGHEAAVVVDFARDNSLTDDDLLLWGECIRTST